MLIVILRNFHPAPDADMEVFFVIQESRRELRPGSIMKHSCASLWGKGPSPRLSNAALETITLQDMLPRISLLKSVEGWRILKKVLQKMSQSIERSKRFSREECSEKTSQAVQQKTAQKIGGVECWHKNVGRIMLVFWEQDTITCQCLMERNATKVYAAKKM